MHNTTLQKQQIMHMNEKNAMLPFDQASGTSAFVCQWLCTDSASLLYLSLGGVEGSPVVGFELVKLIEL